MRRIVILAAGAFPRKGSPARAVLESASRIVCCDGAADACRRVLRREPDAVVGDLDSLRGRFANVVRIADQNSNDLEKAAAYCRERKWRNPVIVGADGLREDHAIGNVFRAIDLGLELWARCGRFIPFDRNIRLRIAPGTPLSVFASRCNAKMSSTGLVWPLDGVKFDAVYRATLNRALSSDVAIRSTVRACVYLPYHA